MSISWVSEFGRQSVLRGCTRSAARSRRRQTFRGFAFTASLLAMDAEAERLRERVELLFEARATLQTVAAVSAPGEVYPEILRVHVFNLSNHPFSKSAYAWEEEGGAIVAMQHGGFIQSPNDAVREAHVPKPA